MTKETNPSFYYSMAGAPTKIRFIIIVYWFLLLYVLSALVWWYIALSKQNSAMTDYRIKDLDVKSQNYQQQYAVIQKDKDRKTAQYIGEGSIFFLLILAGAIYIYRSVKKEFETNRQQQNFMMAVTHELKTPIAVAKLNLETIQKHKLDKEQENKIIGSTIQETNRMNDLCNNLLLSSQMEAGGYKVTLEKMNLSEMISNVAESSKTRYPERRFEYSIAKNLFINGDIFLMQMALNNLIDNAIKYSPKESIVNIDLVSMENKLVFSVTDQGKGIPDDEKKKVFEKYYRAGSEATQKSKGTGLGLFLVKRIIHAHKGIVYVKDNSPKGSVFVVELNHII